MAAAKDRRLHAVRTWPSHSKTTRARPIPPFDRIVLPANSTAIWYFKNVEFLQSHAVTSLTISGTASRDTRRADLNILASSLDHFEEGGVIHYQAGIVTEGLQFTANPFGTSAPFVIETQAGLDN